MGDRGGDAFVGALDTNQSLRVLDISVNAAMSRDGIRERLLDTLLTRNFVISALHYGACACEHVIVRVCTF
jgi:hypothetical protein